MEITTKVILEVIFLWIITTKRKVHSQPITSDFIYKKALDTLLKYGFGSKQES